MKQLLGTVLVLVTVGPFSLIQEASCQEPGTKLQSESKPAWQVAGEKAALPLIEQKKLNSLVIGVIDRSGKKHYLTLGEKPATLEKLDENTIFEIGSITKTMTAFLLADAIQRMEAKLDDPVQSYLPDDMTVPKSGIREITVEDLATHTASLPTLPVGLGIKLIFDARQQGNPYAQFDAEQLKKSLASTKLKENPKRKVEYSNFGAGLLGYALSQKYKKPYETLLHERLFTPLGMKSSLLRVTETDKNRFIDGFDMAGKPSLHWDFQDTIAGAGAVRSTAADMLQYLEAAMGRMKKLQPSFELVTAQQYEMDNRNKIAMGWLITEVNKKRIWWHNGGTGGFSSFCSFCKQPGVGVIVLSNRFNVTGEVDKIGMKVMDSLLGE